MKKLIPILLLILILPTIVSAASYTFKQNDVINYRFRCFDTSGNYCTVTTLLYMNLERQGFNILNNVSLTGNPTFFNVTLPTNLTGTYSAIISGNNLTSTFTYLVTPNGLDDTMLSQLILLGFVFIVAIAMTLFGLNKNEPPWVIIAGLIFVILGLYTLINGVASYRNNLTESVSIIVALCGGYLALRSAWEMIGNG